MREPDGMIRLYIYAPDPVRHQALSHLLSRWSPGNGAQISLATSAEEADIAIWDGAAPTPNTSEKSTEDTPPSPELPTLFLETTLEKEHDQKKATTHHISLSLPASWQQITRSLDSMLNTINYADFTVGVFTCSPLERTLYDKSGNETARLTEKEVRLLQVLSEAGTYGKSRQELLQDVWGYGATLETHTLETHIYRLRQKIEHNPEQPGWLITAEGGYVLLSPTEEDSSSSTEKEIQDDPAS